MHDTYAFYSMYNCDDHKQKQKKYARNKNLHVYINMYKNL